MTSSLPPILQACAGALGSATANALTYPLDLATTRLQTTKDRRLRGLRGAVRVLHHIIRQHGSAALYDGLSTDTAATILSNFLYFYFYSVFRLLAYRIRPPRLIPFKSNSSASKTAKATTISLLEIALGFAAGVASRAVSTPLSVITVQLQTDDTDVDGDMKEKQMDDKVEEESPRPISKKTTIGVVKEIYQADGLAGFWRGFPTTVILSLTPAFILALFQLYRRLVRHSGPVRDFLGAAWANAIVTVALYPLMLAKTLLSVPEPTSPPAASSIPSSSPAHARPRSLRNELHAALARDGMRGLYAGLGAQLAKGALAQGVTMGVKGGVERAAVRVYNASKG